MPLIGPPFGSGQIIYPPIVYPIGYVFQPGQLPSDSGTDGGGPGDTQVGYPNNVGAATPVTPSFAAGTPLVVSYMESGASSTHITEGHAAPPLRIYLGLNAAGPCVPGSLRFTMNGRTYVDRSGSLYYGIDPVTNTGTPGGTIDYENNIATLTAYAAGSNAVTIVSMLTRYQEPGVSGVMFRTTGSPLKEGSFTLRATTMGGVELTASADINGNIIDTDIKGHVDWNSGLVRVAFGVLVTAAGNESQPWYDADLIDGSGKIWKPVQVDPSSIIFGTVVFRSIPIDPALVGIDPVRLPSDGRVLGFNIGTPAVLSHTQLHSLTPTAALVTNLGRERISLVEIYDDHGTPILSTWYTIDLDAGTVTWANPLNLSAYTMPVHIRDRIQDIALISDVEITGEVSLAAPITHDFPSGSVLSNALPYGDLHSRVTNLFDQETYIEGEWSDTLDGSPAGATFNDTVYPLAVRNDSSIDERWAIVFTAPTTVKVIGESVGQILEQSITSDIAPVNPVSGHPYFTITAAGWGSGWSALNVLRFNTVSATRPIWAARVTLPAEIDVDNDSVRINAYGNAT
jgi:hypothetical protein